MRLMWPIFDFVSLILLHLLISMSQACELISSGRQACQARFHELYLGICVELLLSNNNSNMCQVWSMVVMNKRGLGSPQTGFGKLWQPPKLLVSVYFGMFSVSSWSESVLIISKLKHLFCYEGSAANLSDCSFSYKTPEGLLNF